MPQISWAVFYYQMLWIKVTCIKINYSPWFFWMMVFGCLSVNILIIFKIGNNCNRPKKIHPHFSLELLSGYLFKMSWYKQKRNLAVNRPSIMQENLLWTTFQQTTENRTQRVYFSNICPCCVSLHKWIVKALPMP